MTKRVRIAGIVVALALMAVIDWMRPPSEQLSARVLLGGIDLYQAALSPRLSSLGVDCRFEPSCSLYAERAIRLDGAVVGSWRALVRLARCGPWTPDGTVDPP